MPVSPRRRPILVGEQNPRGGDPYYALYPAPEGCAGHRLCCLILGMRRAAYLGAFSRVNLCSGDWSAREARDAAQAILAKRRPVVALGAKVAAAFGYPGVRPFVIYSDGDQRVLLLPHPSGRCRAWNEPGAYRQARSLVSHLYPDVAHLLGVRE